MSSQKTIPVTVAYGDGIGPDITKATVEIIKASGANVSFEEVVVGEKSYLEGYSSGISDDAWKTIRKNRVFLKAPITTPQGSGYKSLNVTIRKALSLFANIRPCQSFHPFIATKHPGLDIVIVRENEEDLYAGVEYRLTSEMNAAVKLISHEYCEQIVRYAFEYAVKNNRKRVTCMSKDNIMKICDGVLHKVFDKIAKEYPQIENDHYIIDIGAARLAARPLDFDVVVTLNLYGDIVSDIVAEVAGSVGMAGSGNIGKQYAMFEAIHGSAPTMAGQNRANPSGILNGAIMMLSHIGQGTAAAKIHNALLYTIESGSHTADIYNADTSKKKLGTIEFGEEVVKNLGQKPSTFPEVGYQDFEFDNTIEPKTKFDWTPSVQVSKKTIEGIDIFVEYNEYVKKLGEKLKVLLKDGDLPFYLHFISLRGFKIFPSEEESFHVGCDQYRCRFLARDGKSLSSSDLGNLISVLTKEGLTIAATFTLRNFDGERGYTLAQGE